MYINAIETEYNGYLFRSRLEARWAVFFDEIGLNWSYEAEGYVLDDGSYYLPDFTIYEDGNIRAIYEIKPLISSDLTLFNKFEDHIKKIYTKSIEEFYLNNPEEDGVYHPYHPKPTIDVLIGDPVCWLTNNGSLTSFDSIKNFICPRCGNIIDDKPYNDENNTQFYCFDCDVKTPCGGRNPREVSKITGLIYEPYKGVLIVNSLQYYELVSRAAFKARQKRFEHRNNN